MNKKLRLLVTQECEHNCTLCCNRQFDLNKIQTVDRWDYDEIMITGGNPLLNRPWYKITRRTIALVATIRKVQKTRNLQPSKIYIYTNTCDHEILSKLSNFADGFVLTPHDYCELRDLMTFNYQFDDLIWPIYSSIRVNLFPEQESQLPDKFKWNKHIIVKHMEWIKDCPVPEGEDFRRLKVLF